MALGFFKSLIQKFTGRPVDWEELEEALVRSDLGVPMTMRILKTLQSREEKMTAESRPEGSGPAQNSIGTGETSRLTPV